MTAGSLPQRRRTIPHLRAGDNIWTDHPAAGGLDAYRTAEAPVACGLQVSTALMTRLASMVRCPGCLTAGQ